MTVVSRSKVIGDGSPSRYQMDFPCRSRLHRIMRIGFLQNQKGGSKLMQLGETSSLDWLRRWSPGKWEFCTVNFLCTHASKKKVLQRLSKAGNQSPNRPIAPGSGLHSFLSGSTTFDRTSEHLQNPVLSPLNHERRLCSGFSRTQGSPPFLTWFCNPRKDKRHR